MNRVFFLAVNNGYYLDGVPNSKCIEFFRKRSSNNLYCTLVGNIVIKGGYPSNSQNGIMSFSSKWNELANAISDEGAIAGVQLSTTWSKYVGQDLFRNSNWNSYEKELKKILTSINIDELFINLRESICTSIDNGFKHIQIHAAHGYLFSILLDPYLYHNWLTIIKRLNCEAQYIKSKGCTSSIRVSNYCGLTDSREGARQNVLSGLTNNGFDYIDISEGYYNFDKNYIYPSTKIQLNSRIERSLQLAQKNISQNYIVSGQISPKAHFHPNVCIGICRELIANPMFLVNNIKKCDNCGDCHYYSKGQTELWCSKWEIKQNNGI